MPRFEGQNAQVLGISVDHVPCLQAWAADLGGIDYPLLSDFWPHGAVSEKYGVLDPKGHSKRALFILDEEGIIRYVDIHDIDRQPDNEVLFRELRRLQGKGAVPEEAPSEYVRPEEDIIMYCSSWCKDCRKARAWLKDRGIDYREVDIYADPLAGAMVRKWTNGKMVTPTFDIRGDIVVRFDADKLEELIG